MTAADGWWRTAIIAMQPNKLLYRGYRSEDLIGRVSYGEMVYLLVRGELPGPAIGRLVDAILVAGCDHGALSPAVAAARMAATCGIPINCAIATGINLLGDIHGGAAEGCMALLYAIRERHGTRGSTLADAVSAVVAESRARDRYLPGFGHPLHSDDPRVRRLYALGGAAAAQGAISGQFLEIARLVERELATLTGRAVPMNIDGAIAALGCEIGFTPQAAKGLFALSRAIGIVAHVLEESGGGARLKGPMPLDLLAEQATYVGPPERDLPAAYQDLPPAADDPRHGQTA